MTTTTTTTTMTLNADVGELRERVLSGDEDALIALLDDANVACGGHAGDDDTMVVTLQRCRRHGVRVGAHPSYPDVAGFGRSRLVMEPAALRASLSEQVLGLCRHAANVDVPVAFIKPHGALYHAIGDDDACADVMADVIDDVAGVIGRRLPLVLFWQARNRARLQARGLVVMREAFADRGTDDGGWLLPRGQPGAVLGVDAAAAVARTLAGRSDIDTVCIHGDGDDATAIARAVRDALGPRSA
jgi:UPF0271 protein